MVDKNSLMASEKDKFFSDLKSKSPLFELGFSEDRLFYDDSTERLERRGAYFTEGSDLEAIKREQDKQKGLVGKNYYSRIAERMKSNEIPQGDFVYMSGIMKPEDRVYTAFSKDEVAKMGTLSGAVPVRNLLDKDSESAIHLEEFVHRALRVVPELNEWRKNNVPSTIDEESLMGAIVSQYFPNLAKYESKRIENNYRVDINDQYNKKILNNWIKQIEKISSDVLKQKKESK